MLTAHSRFCCQSDNTMWTLPATQGYVGLQKTAVGPVSTRKMPQFAHLAGRFCCHKVNTAVPQTAAARAIATDPRAQNTIDSFWHHPRERYAVPPLLPRQTPMAHRPASAWPVTNRAPLRCSARLWVYALYHRRGNRAARRHARAVWVVPEARVDVVGNQLPFCQRPPALRAHSGALQRNHVPLWRYDKAHQPTSYFLASDHKASGVPGPYISFQ